jgi:hypothetical protein
MLLPSSSRQSSNFVIIPITGSCFIISSCTRLLCSCRYVNYPVCSHGLRALTIVTDTMARRRIKQEPGYGSTAADSVDVIPCSRNAAVDEAGKALKSSKSGPIPARVQSSTFASIPEPSERRGIRSGARKFIRPACLPGLYHLLLTTHL